MTAPVWVEIAVSLTALLGNGFFLYQLLRHFLALRSGPLWKVLLLVTLGLASSMIIWVGDPNLLYTFPVFVVLLLVYSKGDRVGRLAVALIFFSLIMSVSALLDTYLFDADTMLTRMSRTAVFGLLFLLLRRHLPQEVAAPSPAAVEPDPGPGHDAAVRSDCSGAAVLPGMDLFGRPLYGLEPRDGDPPLHPSHLCGAAFCHPRPCRP